MQVLESIVNAVISALSMGLIAVYALTGILFPSGEPVSPPAVPATITQPAVPAPEAPAATSTTPSSASNEVKTQSPASAAPSVSAPAIAPPATTPATLAATKPQKSEEAVNADTRAALVNILCRTKVGLNGISGSGIMIDSRGVILTNAHIGQYFLLKDYLAPDNVECAIRTGSPAERRYTATLLFLPAAWVAANAQELKSLQATGTGEHDYAFLLITGRTDPTASLPSSYARVEMDSSYPDIGTPMLLAAYPAGFLSGEIIEKSLYASSAVTYVTQLFSFDDTSNVGLFSIGGTVVSQAGSSGGAVVHLHDGKLAGLIATATSGTETGKRDLRAITISHINRSLAAHGKGGMAPLLSGDLKEKVAEFTAQASTLKQQLEAALGGQ